MEQVTDAELVVQAQTGEESAFAELYERHVHGVYDFSARMLRNPDEAADLTQDAFLRAMQSLPGLQRPERFRSWLFSIARDAALNRIARAGGATPLMATDEEGKEVAMDVVDADRFSNPAEAAEAQSRAALVWEASAALDPRQLSILDLHLRQGMDSAEIAAVLGVTKNNGHVLLKRLKNAVEDSIGAFVMLKEGRGYCTDLDSALGVAEVDGMSPQVRKLVTRHAADCQDCEARRKRLVSPLAVFGAFAAVGAPVRRRAQILEVLRRRWPAQAPTIGGKGDASTSAVTAGSGGAPPASALPVAGGAGGSFFGGSVLSVIGGLAAGAGLLAAMLLLPFSPLALGEDDGNAPASLVSTATATATRSVSPTTTPSPTATGTRSPARTPSPSPTDSPPPPGTTATSTPAPARTSTPTPARTVTPTRTPTPTQPPCVSTVATTRASLSVAPGAIGSFLVSDANACGSLSFTIKVTSPTPWLVVNQPTGQVQGAGTFEVDLAVNDDGLIGEGTFVGEITISGGGSSVVVQVSTQRGAPPVLDDVSGSCHPADVGATVSAVISDDFGVANVFVDYFDAAGVPQRESMTLNDSDTPTAGNWTVETESFGAGGFTVTAIDNGGYQAERDGAGFGPCPG